MNQAPRIFTIYWNPLDAPGRYVVRPFVLAGRMVVPEFAAHVCESMQEARMHIPPGAIRLERDPTDDPCIVESWF